MSVPVEQITKDRFERWTKRFVQASATPMLAIGVGHGPFSGNIVIVTLENEEISMAVIRGLLRDALRQLGAEA